MKKDLHLVALIDKADILEQVIEQLAVRRADIGYAKAAVPKEWRALDSSTVEAYVSGTVEFDYNETQRINMPYITGFLFSCTKEKNDPYDLTWSLSLS